MSQAQMSQEDFHPVSTSDINILSAMTIQHGGLGAHR